MLSTTDKLKIIRQRLHSWKQAKTISKRDFDKYSKIEYVCQDALLHVEMLENTCHRQRKQIANLRQELRMCQTVVEQLTNEHSGIIELIRKVNEK